MPGFTGGRTAARRVSHADRRCHRWLRERFVTKKQRLWLNIGTAIAMVGTIFVFGEFVNPPYDRQVGTSLLSILFVRQQIGQLFKKNSSDTSKSRRRSGNILFAAQLSLFIVIVVASSLLLQRVNVLVGLAIFWACLLSEIVVVVLAERRSTKNAKKVDSDTQARSDLVERSEDR